MFVRFKTWDCIAKGEHYVDPATRKAIVLIDAQNSDYITTASVNMPQYFCPETEIFIKDYSENSGMVDALIAAGIIMPETTFVARAGFETVGRYRLTGPALEKLWDYKKKKL